MACGLAGVVALLSVRAAWGQGRFWRGLCGDFTGRASAISRHISRRACLFEDKSGAAPVSARRARAEFRLFAAVRQLSIGSCSNLIADLSNSDPSSGNYWVLEVPYSSLGALVFQSFLRFHYALLLLNQIRGLKGAPRETKQSKNFF